MSRPSPDQSWLTVALLDIPHDGGLFSDGDWVESKDQDPDGDVRLIQLADIGDGRFLNRSSRFLTSAKAAELKCTYLQTGDVLVARMPEPLGRACVFPGAEMPCVTVVDVCVIRSRRRDVYQPWLMHAINAPQFRREIAKHEAGTTRKRISRKNLGSLAIPLPPRAVQRCLTEAIDAHLSRIDAGVAALERARANLKRYRASVLKAACEGRLVPTEAELARAEKRSYEPASVLLERILKERRARWEAEQLAKMKAAGKTPTDDSWKRKYEEPKAPDTSGLAELPEGWCWATVEQVATKVVDGVHKKPNYVSQGIPFVTVRNLTASRGIALSQLNYITHEDHAEFCKRANPQPGDILISKDGTLGVVRLIRTQEPFSIFVSVALVKPVCRSAAEYLEAAFQSPQVQRQMVPKGSGLQHIHLEDLRRDHLPLPPVAEQVRIVQEVARLLSLADNLEAALSRNLARAQRLRQAVLKAAFEGKLVPADAPEPAQSGKRASKAPASRRRPAAVTA